MKLVKSIVRPNKLDEVTDALARLGVSGVTVSEVRGHGTQRGHATVYRGHEDATSMLPKIEVEIVVADALIDDVIKAIMAVARTGQIGDGRVFILHVDDSYRIRTGERERD